MKAVSGYKDLMCISWSVSEITSRAEKEMKRCTDCCRYIQEGKNFDYLMLFLAY